VADIFHSVKFNGSSGFREKDVDTEPASAAAADFAAAGHLHLLPLIFLEQY